MNGNEMIERAKELAAKAMNEVNEVAKVKPADRRHACGIDQCMHFWQYVCI